MPKVKAFKWSSSHRPARPGGGTALAKPENLTRRTVRGNVEGMTIQGKRVGSWDEYMTSLALDMLIKDGIILRYAYQVPVYGGRDRPGGNVVDFLAEAVLLTYLLDPMGRVWHTGSKEDRFQMERVAHRKGWKLIAWFTDQLTTIEDIYAYLKRQM